MSGTPPSATVSSRQHIPPGDMIARIEDLLEPILDDLSRKQEPSLTIAAEKVCFPGKTQIEARKFARIVLILQLSHDALVSGEVLTKRHIYYQHQELFETQRTVDDLVDRVAKTLESRRDDLNIIATSKGLMAGPLVIELEDESILDVSSAQAGLSIPMTKTIKGIDTSEVNWLLVVEKDAVFRSLCSSRFWENAACGSGLLVTAKGYPDDLTLSFLQHFEEQNSHIPVLALVDCDPDGLNIFRCYRYGSPGTGARGHTRMHWLGIKTGQTLEPNTNSPGLIPLPAIAHHSQPSPSTQSQRSGISVTASREPMTLLSQRDRRVARGMMEKLDESEESDEQGKELMQELRTLLMLGVKAEIQWLDEAGSLTEWLDREMMTTLM